MELSFADAGVADIALSSDGCLAVLLRNGGIKFYRQGASKAWESAYEGIDLSAIKPTTPWRAVFGGNDTLYVTSDTTDHVFVISLAAEKSPRVIQLIAAAKVGAVSDLPVEVIGELKYPQSLTVTPDRKDLYVCNQKGNGLLHFRIDADGKLRFAKAYTFKCLRSKTNYPAGLVLPISVACSPDGAFILCGGAGDGLTALRRDGSGALVVADTVRGTNNASQSLKYIKAIRITKDNRVVASCSTYGVAVELEITSTGQLKRKGQYLHGSAAGISDAIVDGDQLFYTSSNALIGVANGVKWGFGSSRAAALRAQFRANSATFRKSVPRATPLFLATHIVAPRGNEQPPRVTLSAFCVSCRSASRTRLGRLLAFGSELDDNPGRAIMTHATLQHRPTFKSRMSPFPPEVVSTISEKLLPDWCNSSYA